MPMSEYTRAVFGSLQAGEADFARAHAQLQSTIATLEAQLRASLSQPDGDAQQAFCAAKARWDAAMVNLVSVLSNLRGVIGEAQVNYSSTEAANAALWSG
jgi:6 kDa early secretory antigenic target